MRSANQRARSRADRPLKRSRRVARNAVCGRATLITPQPARTRPPPGPKSHHPSAQLVEAAEELFRTRRARRFMAKGGHTNRRAVLIIDVLYVPQARAVQFDHARIDTPQHPWHGLHGCHSAIATLLGHGQPLWEHAGQTGTQLRDPCGSEGVAPGYGAEAMARSAIQAVAGQPAFPATARNRRWFSAPFPGDQAKVALAPGGFRQKAQLFPAPFLSTRGDLRGSTSAMIRSSPCRGKGAGDDRRQAPRPPAPCPPQHGVEQVTPISGKRWNPALPAARPLYSRLMKSSPSSGCVAAIAASLVAGLRLGLVRRGGPIGHGRSAIAQKPVHRCKIRKSGRTRRQAPADRCGSPGSVALGAHRNTAMQVTPPPISHASFCRFAPLEQIKIGPRDCGLLPPAQRNR